MHTLLRILPIGFTLAAILTGIAFLITLNKYLSEEPVVVEHKVKLICWTPFNKMAVYEYEVLPRTPDMSEDDMDNIVTSDNWVFNLRDCE